MKLNWFGLPLMIAFTELMLFGIIIGIISMSIWSIGYFIAFNRALNIKDEHKTIIKNN